MSLHAEYNAAGVPCMGCTDGRVALGGSFKTDTGQWVIDSGAATFVGTGAPPTGPDAAMITLVSATLSAHTPDAAIPSSDTIMRALAKQSRSKVLTQDEEDALDYVETL